MKKPRPEPTLFELLSDPIAVTLMRRDGVDPGYVLHLMAEMKRRLGNKERERLAA